MVTFSHSTIVFLVDVILQSSVHSCTTDTADKMAFVLIAFMCCVGVKSGHSVVDNRGVGSIFNSLHLLYISKGTCIYFLCHTTAEKSIFDLLQ